ncbi:hypothetical protein KIH27_02110 [Mycobacterium sp. M1]|uniref:Uncharacterized protein n=1 Tax=Mycolicibacter acidiphilus TaxID=2835306 RepID=A0ABS5RDX2_9MYCO|nr:hypothetical protein [Mycolicibacter acidiphilus]MBS9532379.1 hypothetical protein [Mycolicibacter acidiphilus]
MTTATYADMMREARPAHDLFAPDGAPTYTVGDGGADLAVFTGGSLEGIPGVMITVGKSKIVIACGQAVELGDELRNRPFGAYAVASDAATLWMNPYGPGDSVVIALDTYDAGPLRAGQIELTVAAAAVLADQLDAAARLSFGLDA